MGEDRITMTKREVERYQAIQRSLRGEMTQAETGEWLGLSERQIRRLVKRVRSKGMQGLVHGNRGRRSPRKMSGDEEERIASIIGERYPDFTPLHVSEKLWERHRIRLSREKVRLIMMAKGLWTRRRRRKADHVWRERKQHVGEMVQMDGSHHAWLEGRGPKLVLMGFVDDATSRFFGRFYDHEGVYPAMDGVRRYIERYGLPQSLYLDKHSTYKTTRQPATDELLRAEQAQTQFERAVGEAGIKVIHAHSPQAKGRIERSFGTLQNRLVKEMRLAGVRNIEEANRFLEGYLETYNRRTMKEARQPQDLHRPWPKSQALDDIFCVQGPRTVNNGCIIQWRGRTFVLTRPTLSLRGQKVVVRECFDGRLSIRFKGKELEYKEVEVKRPEPVVRVAAAKIPRRSQKYTPPPTHPWKRVPFRQIPNRTFSLCRE
jgi:transposase